MRTRAMPLLLAAGLGGILPMALAAPSTAAGPASHVQRLDLAALRRKVDALPSDERKLVEGYFEAARRYVLTLPDGCFPIRVPAERYRNLAERAKGAAVLSSLAASWPAELRQRCRREAAGFVREVALAHRAKPNLEYEWQAAFWIAEAGIAGWFLWDELDADTRDAVAEMVIYQADRFIGVLPKMGYRGNTEAETVAWNSTILTLATNMMPGHPHAPAWEEAAKRYVYNTLAAPQDAASEALGDDGKRVRDWMVGANLHEDLALENHGQFHVDYVLTCYRFHYQGAALYWLTGRPLPTAFRHHARDVYEKVLLPCTTADGFFAYVPDNDWKRYHCWTESATVHAYVGMLEQDPLAQALERRALRSALGLWRAFPQGFAYDNPYVCGKAWTPRIADAVLMHLARPAAPVPALSDRQVDARLRRVSRLDTPDLLTHLTASGAYHSSCRGRGDARILFVAPRQDAWMLLPVAGNYQARIGGKPVIRQAAALWQKGEDWYWVLRRNGSGGSADAFVSLPDGSALYVQQLAAGDLPATGVVENAIAVEKPHVPFHMESAGGSASWRPGETQWHYEGDQSGPRAAGNWLNLQGRMGFVVSAAGEAAPAEIEIPKPGVRDAVRIHTPITPGKEQVLCILALPDRDARQTTAVARQARCSVQGAVVTCRWGDCLAAINFGTAAAAFHPPAAEGATDLAPGTASVWQKGRRLF